MLVGYGFVAAVMPVWLILAPRDYLSTFLKIGTIIALAIGILVVMPDMKMPALTEFASTGMGPVWKGGLFPFLFITIACGAVSGFHALISSGTTPKLLASESHTRYIGSVSYTHLHLSQLDHPRRCTRHGIQRLGPTRQSTGT